jgi:hypothetical protein
MPKNHNITLEFIKKYSANADFDGDTWSTPIDQLTSREVVARLLGLQNLPILSEYQNELHKRLMHQIMFSEAEEAE